MILDKVIYSPAKKMKIKDLKKSDPVGMFKSQTWSYMI